MEPMTIPESDAELTPAWFSAVLGQRVDTVQIEALGEGVGVMATVRRVHLTGAGALPASVIVKLPAPPGPNRETASTYGFYAREVEFYRQAAPSMDLRVPGCFHADSAGDGSGVPFVIVLEDVRDATSVDQLAGCTLAQAELVSDEVAKLHARWWDAPDLDLLDWLPSVDNPAYRGFQAAIEPLQPVLRAKYGDALDERGWSLMSRLEGGGYLEYLAYWERTGPMTFAHYDLRLDNVLFEADRVCLLDWQLAVRHRGTFDLAYFLGQNVTPEFRRTHQERLLRRYHDALTGLGVTGYSFEHCYDDYRGAMVMHVASALQLATLEPGNERGQRLLDAMCTSGWTAACELDSGQVIFGS